MLEMTRLQVILKRGSRRNIFSFLKRFSNMNSKTSYEDAVYALNGLQTNATYLKNARQKRSENPYWVLQDTEKHLETLGIKVDDLDHLNVVHVSGTKGKGSTCAFTESILRHHDLKTGFYSSPHLISVNERIRINGHPLEKKKFAFYFWHVYRHLQQSRKNEPMPSYFYFLTVMAFYVFVKEKIDVAILEVGIGGLYDCTNIIKKPVVVGVSTLGLDHVSLLGNTLDLIAKQKAGIFKPGVPAFTVPQPDIALNVLIKKAHEVGCPLAIAPPLSCYVRSSDYLNLGLPGSVQNQNACLAVQLCQAWLTQRKIKNSNTKNLSTPQKQNTDVEHLTSEYIADVGRDSNVPMAPTFDLDDSFCKGLQFCVWPGRFSTLKKKNFTFYLDGAHTLQSIKHCIRWFEDASSEECRSLESPVSRVLIFNCTGERKAEALLSPLSDISFDLALFTPNSISLKKDSASDQSNFTVDSFVELAMCKENAEIWRHFMSSLTEKEISMSSQVSSTHSNGAVDSKKHSENVVQFSNLGATLQWVMNDDIENNALSSNSLNVENIDLLHLLNRSHHIQVLVTGSLHLVGGVLSIIDPDLSGTCSFNQR